MKTMLLHFSSVLTFCKQQTCSVSPDLIYSCNFHTLNFSKVKLCCGQQRELCIFITSWDSLTCLQVTAEIIFRPSGCWNVTEGHEDVHMLCFICDIWFKCDVWLSLSHITWVFQDIRVTHEDVWPDWFTTPE